MVHILPGVDKHGNHSLALFESSYGVERMLPGKTKILKVWNDWQTETNNVRFILRQAETAPKISYAKRTTLYQKVRASRTKPFAVGSSNRRKVLNYFPKLEGSLKNKDVAVSKDQLDYIKDIYLKDLEDNDLQHPNVARVDTHSRERAYDEGRVKVAQRKSIAKVSQSSIFKQVKFAVTKNLSRIAAVTQGQQTNGHNKLSREECAILHRQQEASPTAPIAGGVPQHLTDQTEGKQDILRRYLDGYVPQRRQRLRECRRQLFVREFGDRQEDTVYGLAQLRGDGSEIVTSPLPLYRPAYSPPPSPIRRKLNVESFDSFDNMAATEAMVSGHIEVQCGVRNAVIKKQTRLIDTGDYKQCVLDSSGSDEDLSDAYSMVYSYSSASHLPSAGVSVHDRIASLLDKCVIHSGSEEELSSSGSVDMSL